MYKKDKYIGKQEVRELLEINSELVEALESLLPLWSSGIEEPWIVKARATLAKAKGE